MEIYPRMEEEEALGTRWPERKEHLEKRRAEGVNSPGFIAQIPLEEETSELRKAFEALDAERQELSFVNQELLDLSLSEGQDSQDQGQVNQDPQDPDVQVTHDTVGSQKTVEGQENVDPYMSEDE